MPVHLSYQHKILPAHVWGFTWCAKSKSKISSELGGFLRHFTSWFLRIPGLVNFAWIGKSKRLSVFSSAGNLGFWTTEVVSKIWLLWLKSTYSSSVNPVVNANSKGSLQVELAHIGMGPHKLCDSLRCVLEFERKWKINNTAKYCE